MTCDYVALLGGTAIVCSSRKTKRCKCGAKATLLCDWKLGTWPDGKVKTCDDPMCAKCATSPARDKHVCPRHVDDLRDWQAKQRARVTIYSE